MYSQYMTDGSRQREELLSLYLINGSISTVSLEALRMPDVRLSQVDGFGGNIENFDKGFPLHQSLNDDQISDVP